MRVWTNWLDKGHSEHAGTGAGQGGQSPGGPLMVPFSTSSFLTPLALTCPSGHSTYRGLGCTGPDVHQRGNRRAPSDPTPPHRPPPKSGLGNEKEECAADPGLPSSVWASLRMDPSPGVCTARPASVDTWAWMALRPQRAPRTGPAKAVPDSLVHFWSRRVAESLMGTAAPVSCGRRSQGTGDFREPLPCYQPLLRGMPSVSGYLQPLQ